MMTEPIEALGVALTGSEIIEDLCGRLADGLADNCYLLGTDAYQSYSAPVTVEIQLADVDSQTVKKTLVIGDHDSATPSRRIVVNVPLATTHEVRERSGQEVPSLERRVDGSEPVTPVKPARRYYTPRKPRNVVG
ncbi:MAG: hypothetical protein WCA89_12760 [Terracidiphilus sp.]